MNANGQEKPGTADRHEMVGRSPAIEALRRLIAEVAPTPSTVLIQGETGTGKELVARALHWSSSRSHGPLVALNCGALPENLLETELFGHERSAFTGADARRIGKFEQASGGTLFLDEVGELPLPVQIKLLRALEEREIDRVGGNRPVPVDIRIVAATNRPLEEAVSSGRFRQDLYYRLKVIAVRMPPLRERIEDVLLLAGHFLARYAKETGRMVRGLSREAASLLERYDWPGNVRELRNAIESAVALGGGADPLPAGSLPEEVRGAGGCRPSRDGARYYTAISEARRREVEEALVQARGDCGKAAGLLGVHRKYIYRLARRLGLGHLLASTEESPT